LYGGSGSDVIDGETGSGNDTISNYGKGTDTVQFRNLVLASFEFSKQNNNLVCTFDQTGETVTVSNWCMGTSYL